MRQADKLFRRLGFTKTTVADIAAELDMSPANVYKFFPSKNAIIEAGADRSLEEKKIALRLAAKAGRGCAQRLEKVALTLYQHHREAFRHERQIYKLVLTATEENWACIRHFKDFLSEIISDIVRDGIKTGNLRPTDVTKATESLLDSLTWVINPLLFHELDHREVEKRIIRQASLLEKALKA